MAGLWLVPALAAGPGRSPDDLCRAVPPSSARECRMAADLLMHAEPVPKAAPTVRVTA
ncbi:hypothetical protein Q8W71_05080 [Methylobacterium sp. NEAU 140]|uniref:hypothetical protein n=1 Tax=Methylobacterium sp. NEAU 140 TaxID=3064945 RepID=UPI002733B9E2|nr:hypothetical protein [Methylobacterium sp. NEAU 140]MDP4021991.1 hypothetical protein [Methylobacterium sp. NEAU 140]